MEASNIIIGGKTYDLNFVGKKKKTNLRRKLIIEYIQSKPAGEHIKMRELQQAGQFSTSANAHAFVQRMIRDGVIQRHQGDRPKSFYYSVIGAVRVKKPAIAKDGYVPPRPPASEPASDNLRGLIDSLTDRGLRFTITITNEKLQQETIDKI